MDYTVKTPVFEGPLDLLLRLISEHQLEITEVSLTDLVGEYLAQVDLMRRFDLEVGSEFLVIASTLIQMKARRLLPDSAPADLDEELAFAQERDRLLSRLLSCLTFKDVAAVLAARLETTDHLLGRYRGLDPDVTIPRPAVQLGIGLTRLGELAQSLLGPRPEPELDHVDFDLASVEEAITALRARLAAELESDFETMTGHLGRTGEVIAYFLAVLELARWGIIEARQQAPDAAIVLRHRRDSGAELPSSEWTR